MTTAAVDDLSDEDLGFVFSAGLLALQARDGGSTDALDAARWRYFDTPQRWFQRDPQTGLFSVGINVFVDGAFHHAETQASGAKTLRDAIDAALGFSAAAN